MPKYDMYTGPTQVPQSDGVNAPPFSLCKEERRLIEALREHHGWGEATVVLKGGKPVMLKGLREDVKLSDSV